MRKVCHCLFSSREATLLNSTFWMRITVWQVSDSSGTTTKRTKLKMCLSNLFINRSYTDIQKLISILPLQILYSLTIWLKEMTTTCVYVKDMTTKTVMYRSAHQFTTLCNGTVGICFLLCTWCAQCYWKGFCLLQLSIIYILLCSQLNMFYIIIYYLFIY